MVEAGTFAVLAAALAAVALVSSSPTAVSPEPEVRVRFARRPADRNLTAGDRLRLRCEVRVDSERPVAIRIRWLKNEAPLEDRDRDRVEIKRNVSENSASSTLRIESATVHDRGYYDCVVGADGRKRANATALVLVRPLFGDEADDANDANDANDALEMEDPSPTFVSDVVPSAPGSTPPEPEAAPPRPPLCQPYVGAVCADFLGNRSVYVPFETTQTALELKLKRAFSVISYSKEISSACESYAKPSLCYSTFPICRTPELTNLEFGAGSIDATTGPAGVSRSSISLRRVCRGDCEVLENELCQKEYAIAKRHPEIGQKLTLEECDDLPDDPDCLTIGTTGRSEETDACYWETGVDYRGDVNVAASGLPCIIWSHQFVYKITDNPELVGGHDRCRNPGGAERQPWCFVERGDKLEKQPCDVPKCSRRIWIYIISAIAGSGALLLACALFACRRHRSSKNDTAAIRNINLPNADKNIYGNSRMSSPIELADFLGGRDRPGGDPRPRSGRALEVPDYSLSKIRFVEELGEGAFGKVYKGEVDRGTEVALVAIKALKENASRKTRSDFKREMELISELRHENIVCILGVVLREEPMCMLFEFMAKGDLHEYLVGRAPPNGPGLDPARFLTIAHHVSSGMEYLAAHHYVHRDLAARNCLVADDLVVKISDFGLSRDIYSSDYYRVQSKSLLPVRWMPPESILYGKFTTESDVWSYGVVLWEIYSYGLQPYYGYSNQEVIAMVRGRELLRCPSECPRAMYNLMRECWHQTPAKRPDFTAISLRLKEWRRSNVVIHGDNGSDSSGALSSNRPPLSVGDPRERMPLIGHHSSSNGSLAGSMPRKLSAAGSNKSHASTRLMMSSSDVTSGSDNCENSAKMKKLSCGSLLDDQTSFSDERRDMKITNRPF